MLVDKPLALAELPVQIPGSRVKADHLVHNSYVRKHNDMVNPIEPTAHILKSTKMTILMRKVYCQLSRPAGVLLSLFPLWKEKHRHVHVTHIGDYRLDYSDLVVRVIVEPAEFFEFTILLQSLCSIRFRLPLL